LVTKLEKNYIKTYFLECCTGGAKNVNFWKTVKPFFSKKCNSGDQNIILYEVNKIINDTCEVSEKFNTFFSTVADEIGKTLYMGLLLTLVLWTLKIMWMWRKNLNSSIYSTLKLS
jgi:hypothetical protein